MAGSTHVLIVDDDADLREVVTLCLQSAGYSVSDAVDGQCALAALASSPRTDVIILDLAMPVMDGRTFLEHKAAGPHAAIPVVIFSASPSHGLEKLPGVAAVLSKIEGLGALLWAIASAQRRAPAALAPAGGFHA